MRGVFDEEAAEQARRRPDTEVTLGSATLLAIFFGLVLLCGLCFGMGYAVGHRGGPPTAIAPAQPAPDQEPLQPSGNIPKPSAIAQTPVTPPEAAQPDAAAATATASGATPAVAAQTAQGAVAPAQSQPEVRPAFGSSGAPQNPQSANPQSASTQSASTQRVRPALPSAASVMVQIAAVSNPEDAEVLVNALRQRGYPVTARREPADNLIHVRIGPFATAEIAGQWRLKLLNDGYNAIVQP